MTADQVRAAVEAHEPADGMTQWYVDEFCIDCDAREFWAVAAKAEAAAIKRAVAAAYRQAGAWLPDVQGEAMISVAAQVEAFEPGDACCPCCEEVTCDPGCPLETVRAAAQEIAAQVIRGEVIHDETPSVATHIERARPDAASVVASLTPDEFAEFTRKHGVRWEPQ